MTDHLPSISFGITGSFMSLSEVSWTNVPGFAVLTGVNGAGKTQLLEAIYYGITGLHQAPVWLRQAKFKLGIAGDEIGNGDVVYVPANSPLSAPNAVGIAEVQNQAKHAWQHGVRGNQRHYQWVKKFVERETGQPASAMSESEFFAFAMENPAVFLHERQLLGGLAPLFLSYRASLQKLVEQKRDYDKAVEELGPAPWTVLNNLLRDAGFPYRLTSPEKTDLFAPFELKLTSEPEGVEVLPGTLSSGEQQLLALVLWLYRTSQKALPKLLLMDEPDAYLHPSLTRQFLDTLANVLVARYEVRVIITTHSPSTVALAPPESVFEMRRDKSPRVVKSGSKWETVGLLTSGLVTVGPHSKYVFVEDDSDREFFTAVQDILKEPSRATAEMPDTERYTSLVFIPASKGDHSGGRSKVLEWVRLLEGSWVHGIVDGDNRESALPDRVWALQRYEMENYLLDPVNVYAYLIGRGAAPPVDGVHFKVGEESKLLAQSDAFLDSVARTVLDPVAGGLASLDESANLNKEAVRVKYISGQASSLPRWFLETKGRRMVSVFRKAHGRGISPDELRLTMQRMNWIPMDLFEMLQSIQRA